MRVALVGAEFEENLAVRYLRGALERAGHDVVQLVFNRAEDIERTAVALARSGAALAGLSMVFTHRAREFAGLAARARELGFRGHIVAGGHFAAFHAEELIRDVPAIDSAAIGEGEELMCELATHLARPGCVRGLVWRDAGTIRRNAPADKPPDLDRLAPPPRKSPLDEYLGLGITNLLSSRGCSYSCTFCSIVAWHRLCGGERVRMREVEHVADEMASLHARGARIFNFHDDNFFLPDRSATLERIATLERALHARGVGRIAFAIKARPDAVDEAVFRALKAMGLFRVFLGIEAGSPRSLKQLGRRQTVDENRHALEVVNRLDIHTAFNLLLLNPDSTLEDVADNVAFLRAHPDNPTNFCRTEIYTGTPLEKKLRREGRLLGDYWGYDYVIADPRAQLAFEVIYRAFRTRNYGESCLHHLAMAVDYEHQLLGHFFAADAELRLRVKRFVATVNRNTADHLDVAIAGCAQGFASADRQREFERELGAAVARDNARLGARAHALLDDIRARAARPVKAPWTRTARAMGLAAGVALATSACRKSGEDTHPTEMVAPPPTQPVPGPVRDAAPADAGQGDATARDAAPPKPPPDASAPAPKPTSSGPHRAGTVPVPGPPARPHTHPTEMVAPPMDEPLEK